MGGTASGAVLAAALAMVPTAALAAADDPRLSPWAVTGFLGTSIDRSSLSNTVFRPWNEERGAETFLGLAGSYRLGRVLDAFTLDAEAGLGTRQGRRASGETWGALYLRFDGFPWRERLYTSIGASTGLSWISRLPLSEVGTPDRPERHRSRVLHYFSPEIAVALPHRRQHELVLRYHHRSGIFGTIGGVVDGSNVITIGWRYRLGRD